MRAININDFDLEKNSHDEILKWIVDRMKELTKEVKQRTNNRSYQLMLIDPVIKEYDSYGKGGQIGLRMENGAVILNLVSIFCGSPTKDFLIRGPIYEANDISLLADMMAKEADEIKKKMDLKYGGK